VKGKGRRGVKGGDGELRAAIPKSQLLI